MDKIKVGCVGLSRGLSLLCDMADDERVSITAVCDCDTVRLSHAIDKLAERGIHPAAYESYVDFLASDTDAVIIATEIAAHVPMTAQAMNSGKHVLSEIPPADDMEQLKELVDTVRSHPELTYMTAENCCYWEFILEYKRMYDEGLLGDVWYMEGEYIHDVTSLMRDRDGNPTWRAALDAIRYLTHDLGPLLYITGDRCVSVNAFAPEIDATNGFATGKANEVAIFRTEKGALIRIFTSFAPAMTGCRHNFTLYGTKATVQSDRYADFSHGWFEGEYKKIEVGQGSAGSVHGGADKAMLRAFITSLTENAPSPLDVDYAVKIGAPGIIAADSARMNGAALEIPVL